MSAATTRTGRPKLGGAIEVHVTDPDEWLQGTIAAVGDSKPDEFGQKRIVLIVRFNDGTSTGWVYWDNLEWRAA